MIPRRVILTKYNALKMLQKRGYSVSLPEPEPDWEEFPEKEMEAFEEFVNSCLENTKRAVNIDDVRVAYEDKKDNRNPHLLMPGEYSSSKYNTVSFTEYMRLVYKDPKKDLSPITALSEVFWNPNTSSFLLLYYVQDNLVKEEYVRAYSLAESLKIPYTIMISEKVPHQNIAQNFKYFAPRKKNETIKTEPPLMELQHFTYSELIMCIGEHALAPKNIQILSDEEKKKLEAVGVSTGNMIYRESDDPLIKFWGIGTHEAIKFISTNEISGTLIDEYLEYAYVVPSRAKK